MNAFFLQAPLPQLDQFPDLTNGELEALIPSTGMQDEGQIQVPLPLTRGGSLC